jgi:hypothetical protein
VCPGTTTTILYTCRRGQTKTTGFSQKIVIYFPENISRIAYVIGDRVFCDAKTKFLNIIYKNFILQKT